MTTISPTPGVLPSASPATSPAPTPAEPRSSEPEQPPSAGGFGADDPSGIGAILAAAHFNGDESEGASQSDAPQGSVKLGLNQVFADLGTLA